jgi:hypothetical protein
MERLTRSTALVTAVGVVTIWGVALAAQPTQSDFDVCNREALRSGGNGAASPGTTGGTMSRRPDTSGSVSGGARTPDTSGSVPGGAGSGSTGGSASGGISGGTTGGSLSGGASSGTTSGGVSASGSDKAHLQGIASAGMNDPAYKQAYGDCMRQRGF